MNKYKLFLTSIFLFIAILPIKVGALSHKKDLVDLKSNVAFETNEIELTNENGSDYNINSFMDTYGNGQYALTKYKIDIKVNENNTFNISEYITAYFNINKHGIFRNNKQ